MKRFSQQDLMKAHNLARHNASVEDAKAASEAVVVEPVDPNRKAQPFPYDEHPFGNNDNNRKVAERIAREQATLEAGQPAALSPSAAALADLKAAAAFDDGEEKELSEEEQEAKELAALAAGLDAKKAAEEKARIMALPDDNAEKIALLDAEKAKQPPKPSTPPSWRGNA